MIGVPVGSALLLAGAPAAAMGQIGLPTNFFGEVAAVALAFTFPALLAGAYLGLKRLASGHGLRGALVIATLALCVGFGVALHDARPDLLGRWTGL